MSNAKKAGLSRDQAAALYEDLRKNFAAYGNGPGKADPNVRATMAKLQQAKRQPPPSHPQDAGDIQAAQLMAMMASKQRPRSGSRFAVSLLLMAGLSRILISGLEFSGVLGVEAAVASVQTSSQRAIAQNLQNYSAEEVALLKTLDGRRVELEDRRKRLDRREEEMQARDREFAVKLAELREMTQSLKMDREQTDKKKTAQLDQLSNVYGSMDPREAALLIEQLDEAIALELLNRMPEKRIGQILSLMNKDKALVITKMLSGKK